MSENRSTPTFQAPPRLAQFKGNPEFGAPGITVWAEAAWKRIQELEEAVRAACDLIWNQDAVWIVGGPASLDAWVDRCGPLVGFTTEESDV